MRVRSICPKKIIIILLKKTFLLQKPRDNTNPTFKTTHTHTQKMLHFILQQIINKNYFNFKEKRKNNKKKRINNSSVWHNLFLFLF